MSCYNRNIMFRRREVKKMRNKSFSSWVRKNLNIPSGFTVFMVIFTIVGLIAIYFIGSNIKEDRNTPSEYADVRSGEEISYDILDDEYNDNYSDFGREDIDGKMRFVDVKVNEAVNKKEIENLLIHLSKQFKDESKKEKDGNGVVHIGVFVNEIERDYGLPIGEYNNFYSEHPQLNAVDRDWSKQPDDETYRIYKLVSEEAIKIMSDENNKDLNMEELEQQAIQSVAKDEKYSEDEIREMGLEVTDFMQVPEYRENEQ